MEARSKELNFFPIPDLLVKPASSSLSSLFSLPDTLAGKAGPLGWGKKNLGTPVKFLLFLEVSLIRGARLECTAEELGLYKCGDSGSHLS